MDPQSLSVQDPGGCGGDAQAGRLAVNRFGPLNPDDPEFSSVESFVESLWDDDCDRYTCFELQCLCYHLGLSTGPVKAKLAEWDLELEVREHEKYIRGFSSPDHDRWYGKGSSRTHGGSGWEQISGFAGRAG